MSARARKEAIEASGGSEMIDRHGGTCAVAKLCKLAPSTVSGWRKTGIPKGWLAFIGLSPQYVRRPDAVEFPPVDWSAYTGEQRMHADLDCALRKLIACGLSPDDAVRVLGELASDCERAESVSERPTVTDLHAKLVDQKKCYKVKSSLRLLDSLLQVCIAAQRGADGPIERQTVDVLEIAQDQVRNVREAIQALLDGGSANA